VLVVFWGGSVGSVGVVIVVAVAVAFVVAITVARGVAVAVIVVGGVDGVGVVVVVPVAAVVRLNDVGCSVIGAGVDAGVGVNVVDEGNWFEINIVISHFEPLFPQHEGKGGAGTTSVV